MLATWGTQVQKVINFPLEILDTFRHSLQIQWETGSLHCPLDSRQCCWFTGRFCSTKIQTPIENFLENSEQTTGKGEGKRFFDNHVLKYYLTVCWRTQESASSLLFSEKAAHNSAKLVLNTLTTLVAFQLNLLHWGFHNKAKQKLRKTRVCVFLKNRLSNWEFFSCRFASLMSQQQDRLLSCC